MLNSEHYNWRNLLYRVSAMFKSLCPVRDGDISVLIIDDTAKEKTGHKGENTSWFVNHSTKSYYKGFQVILSAWSNGRTLIPLDFELKIGKSKVKRSKKGRYRKGSHTEQRQRMAKQSKIKISLQLIKRGIQRGFKFKYLLWDSWYNSSESLAFVFHKLVSKGIHLVSMVKRDRQKYLYEGNYYTIKGLHRLSGKMRKDPITDVKFKSIIVSLSDKRKHHSNESIKPLGEVRMCFYRYPNCKKYKVIITTDTKLAELEVLSLYLQRWAIEVLFKDLKQHFGYDQSKSSKYAPQIADLTIRCVFYTMFCYLKDNSEGKSTEQIMFEFYREMQESCLDIFSQLVFYKEAHSFFDYLIKKGYKNLDEVRSDLDTLLHNFFEQKWGDYKIDELDNLDFSQFRYKKTA
jgi:hypothetical protein